MPPRRRTDEAQADLSSGHFAVVTPSDATDLAFLTRRVEIGVGGTLSVIAESGDQVDLPAMPDGHVFHIRVSRIRESSTTADGIVAYY